ncbi:TLC domain-containing protein 3A isoform X2 [Leptinotarsa decemlineata]|uniref:TLC domain-containing protein 3A isoform X2 n=1 Tax=Leptinotarsa decemlineata TaxID=7539 RepID=UPI000C253A49|nr:protein FAM57A isoform X2 [Leptinotarsa decemlineata]
MDLVHFIEKTKQKKAAFMVPCLILVILSLSVSIVTVRDLEWEDHISIRYGLVLFVSGLVFFPSLYLALNALFLHTNNGRKIVRTYKLSHSDVYDISNKQVSAVQALFCCITGLTSVCYSCSRNILRTSHYISEAYAWFGAAYFFYDIWSMYKVYSSKVTSAQMNGDAKRINRFLCGLFKILDYLKNNSVIVGHHIFIGCFGFLVITYLRGGLGDCFYGFIYLMEASTPFVSLRGILSKIGLKDSPLYVINGLMMLAVFFLCRIAMFPYVIYMYATSIQVDFISAIYTLPRGCLISISILLLPQLYWFYLMVMGATKVLRNVASNNNTLKNSKTK